LPQDRDFVIELDGEPGNYRLHVSSPSGDDSARVGLDPARLGVDLETLQAWVLASATTRRAMRVPELERPLRQVGQDLFEAVFQPSARALFLSSRNEVERAGDRLRIVLRLHAPELAILPWELLFSDNYGGYLCRRSPMVRYIDVPEPVRPLTAPPPLRVLGMTALPGDLAALDADTEQRRMRQVLAPLQARGLVAVDWVSGQSWEAVQEALYGGCHVFHFIGHGGFDPDRGEGVIAFADHRGRRQPVGASLLAELLSVADPMPRLVVLNSCQTGAGGDADVFSSTAATLVRTVPAVVAMQFAVTDDAASVFSREFYKALVHNRGVDEAVRAGRIALTGWNAATMEWVTPVLYLRTQDTHLFHLADPGATPGTAEQPAREAVLAAYWAARSTGDWEPVITQLAALHHQLPGDLEVEQAYHDARLAARYAQGRRAESGQDWAGAAAHYEAVASAQPEYRDVVTRLAYCASRRDIVALQKQLRTMFAAGQFQAVVGIADRLAELDPAAADPDGLTTQARQQTQHRNADLSTAEPIPAAIPALDTGPLQYPEPVSELAKVKNSEAAHTSPRIKILTGHTGEVLGVVFSPDGRLLASSGGKDHTVLLWDPATGEECRTLTGHTDMVRSVAFSPDGRLLVSGSDDLTVRLWDPATGEQRGVLTGHTDQSRRLLRVVQHVSESILGVEFSPLGVVFSPDGRLLASGSRDRMVRLWDPATGEQRGVLTGHTDWVWSVAFSPDGRLLASGSRDGTVRLWDPATGEQRGVLTGHTDMVCSVAFSPDGRLLASGSRDGTVRLWDPYPTDK
jgi:hypothetical protein